MAATKPVRSILLLLSWLILSCNATLVAKPAGFMEMEFISSHISERNALTRALLNSIATFLEGAFAEVEGFSHFTCTVQAYVLGGFVQDATETTEASIYYAANFTIMGQAFFEPDATHILSPQETLMVTSNAFDDNEEFMGLLDISEDPFLRNLQFTRIKVNGVHVGDGAEFMDKQQEDSDEPFFDLLGLSMWQLSIVAGVAAFTVVLCFALLCICFITRRERTEIINKVHSLGVTTKPTGMSSNYPEEDDRTPSPMRSITSQDSSVFTYNPKSVHGYKSRSTGSYFSAEPSQAPAVELETWQDVSLVDPNNLSLFGNDISDIEKRYNLSLIEEERSTHSGQSTPDGRKGFDSNKLTSLLHPNNDEGDYEMPDDEANDLHTNQKTTLLSEVAVASMQLSERAVPSIESSTSGSGYQFYERRVSTDTGDSRTTPTIGSTTEGSTTITASSYISRTNSGTSGTGTLSSGFETSSTFTKSASPTNDVMQVLADIGVQIDQFRGTR